MGTLIIAGTVVAKVAKSFVESEFEKYRLIQDKVFESDFDRLLKEENKILILCQGTVSLCLAPFLFLHRKKVKM